MILRQSKENKKACTACDESKGGCMFRGAYAIANQDSFSKLVKEY